MNLDEKEQSECSILVAVELSQAAPLSVVFDFIDKFLPFRKNFIIFAFSLFYPANFLGYRF
jgi:hypothetical protein